MSDKTKLYGHTGRSEQTSDMTTVSLAENVSCHNSISKKHSLLVAGNFHPQLFIPLK